MNPMHRDSRWMQMLRSCAAGAGLTLAAVVLSGCATSRNVDSEVRSFGGATPIAAGATYRFERLPSQDTEALEPLETAAQKALAAKGLVRADAKASYSVQVHLDVGVLVPDSLSRWASAALPGRVVLAPDGSLWQQVRRPLMDTTTWYRYNLHVVMRDLSNGSVAYDTRAVHESAWSDTPNLVGPLLEAALRDFPDSESKPKTITVVLPHTDAKP